MPLISLSNWKTFNIWLKFRKRKWLYKSLTFCLESKLRNFLLRLFIFMIKTLLKRNFSTTIDVLSTKNLKKFGCNDYPQALNYSRPFSTHPLTKTSQRLVMESLWRHSLCIPKSQGSFIHMQHFSLHQVRKQERDSGDQWCSSLFGALAF
jgi:hypothetical protein